MIGITIHNLEALWLAFGLLFIHPDTLWWVSLLLLLREMMSKKNNSSTRFEDDFLFAPPVKSGMLEEADRVVYWKNGLGEEHNAFSKLISEHKTRQQGFEKAVYGLACDKDGNLLYKGKYGISEFHKGCDRTKTRDYGMLILGISKSEEPTEFDKDVEGMVKNSEKEEEASTDS